MVLEPARRGSWGWLGRGSCLMAGKGARERQPVGLGLKDGLAETQVIGG